MTGGCADWCYDNPGMNSSEIYDLDLNVWKKAADLPLPLNSHKLEPLGGLPTVIGGYDRLSDSRNSKLFQYHPEKDEWLEHPDPRNTLRIPRSSAAVFQVPKDISPLC